MRIGLIWNRDDPHVRTTVRYERYMRGMRTLGHDAVMFCTRRGGDGFREAVQLVDELAAFTSPGYWARQNLDAAIVVTYLSFAPVLGALKSACPWVVSIADSDGKIGVHAHPGAMLGQMIAQHRRWGMKLRAAKYWLQLYMGDPGGLDQSVLASAEHADRIVVCSPASVQHLGRFFASYHRPDLAAKVIAAPYPVDECYLAEPVATHRENRVVAIGRWDDPQKDAGLLCRAVERHLAAGGRSEVVLFGAHGAPWFAPLAARWPQVRDLGVQPPAVIAEHMRNSRSLLLPSRWESGPIVLNEALASGCSIVGTPSVPSVVSACADGPFGTVAAGRSATRLAAALGAEMAAWDRGERDAGAIATFWRPRFEPAAVCRQLLEQCVVPCA